MVHTTGTDMGLYERTYGLYPEKYYDSVDFHRQIADAIANRDEQAAEDIMRDHIESIRTNTDESEDEE